MLAHHRRLSSGYWLSQYPVPYALKEHEMTLEATVRSQAELLALAKRVIPGGAISTEALPDDTAFVVERAQGSKLYAVDGREYIDYVMGSGPMVLGHGHPEVVAAAQAQVARGTTYFTVNR